MLQVPPAASSPLLPSRRRRSQPLSRCVNIFFADFVALPQTVDVHVCLFASQAKVGPTISKKDRERSKRFNALKASCRCLPSRELERSPGMSDGCFSATGESPRVLRLLDIVIKCRLSTVVSAIFDAGVGQQDHRGGPEGGDEDAEEDVHDQVR